MDTEAESTTWLIVWDDRGLDTLINLTEMHSNEIMQRLQEGSAPDNISRILRIVQLRARLNIHLNRETWVFEVGGGADENYLRSVFETDPDGIKQMIRDNGIKQFI
jgi:hypothetical protein